MRKVCHHVGVKTDDRASMRRCSRVHRNRHIDAAESACRASKSEHGSHQVEIVIATVDVAIWRDPLGNGPGVPWKQTVDKIPWCNRKPLMQGGDPASVHSADEPGGAK